MNVIMLSGGSGKRLWPLSNDIRSKQFLKIFRVNNTYESMMQQMYRKFVDEYDCTNILVAAPQNQEYIIKSQIGTDVDISIEPCRRDTFPAIALACSFLKKKGFSNDESVVVCPVDSYTDEDFIKSISELYNLSLTGKHNISLIGIKPSFPSNQYGYIQIKNNDFIAFKEKPSIKDAERYIKEGALWNSGVFAFKIGYVLNIAKNEFGTDVYEELQARYDKLEKTSFDYAVVEKEKNIGVIVFDGIWKDIGTWKTFTEVMSENIKGNVISSNCKNSHIINELSIPLISLGLDNEIVVATSDGILVGDKEQCSNLKEYVQTSRPMYEIREWGEYKILDTNIQGNGENSLTKHIIISKGKHISYQYHEHRTEIWTVIEGTGKIIIDDEVLDVKFGDSITIKVGTRHAIQAETELHVIETQIGTFLDESDIHRLEYDWEKLKSNGEIF